MAPAGKAAKTATLPPGYRGPQKTTSARSRGVDVLPAARAPTTPLASQNGVPFNPDDPRVMWERARSLLESCPAARAIGEPCATAEESEPVWRVLSELLEAAHVDVGMNLALALERFDQYYDAMLVWEDVIMANPDAYTRASQECSKVISLVAREMGVPGAGSEHPDPEVEQRRRKERAEQGVAPDSSNVGGGLGETQSEMRHLQDDALAIQEEAKRLMLTEDCAGENGYHRVVACHSRAAALLSLLMFVVPNHGAAVGQLTEALAGSGRYRDALQLLNRMETCAPLGVLGLDQVGFFLHFSSKCTKKGAISVFSY